MARSGVAGTRIAAILAPVLGAGIICIALWQWSVLARHNTIQELQDLPVNSAVHLIGVVTYVDEPGGRFWIQDETGAIPISANPVQAGVRAGQTISIDATKTTSYDHREGPISVGLQEIRVHPTAARVRLPQPFPVTLANFPTPEKNGIRVQMTAVVEDASLDGQGRAHLSVADGGPEVELIVAKPDSDYSSLINSRIRIVGLPEQERTPQGALVRNRIWAPSVQDLQIE